MQADFSAARNNMVDSQVRPNKVTDPRILDAMRILPREDFVPPGRAGLAYVDEDVPIGRGRVLMEPMVIARLVQLTRTRPGERVLVVGAGAGYGAALLEACGGLVTALEQDEALAALARKVLSRHAPGVTVVTGPLAQGWPAGAPWDVILIEGAVKAIPEAMALQVRGGAGRLVTALSLSGGTCQAVLAEPVGTGALAGLRTRVEFDCATPLLPALLPPPQFSF